MRELDWGELQDLANQAAHTLAARGVTRGDRVAVVLPPTPETAAIFFGVWKLGAILLSMSVLYGDDGIEHRLSDSAGPAARHRPRERAALRPAVGAGRARARARTRWPPLRPTSSASTRPPTTPPSSTTPPGRPASRRASSTRTATSSPTRSSSTATRSRTASASTGWASGRGRPGSRRCSARGGSGRCSASTAARAASTRTGSSTSSSRQRGHERLHDADRDALDDGDRRRGDDAIPRSSGASARPGSRSIPRRSAGSASSTASRCSTSTGSPSRIRSSRTSRSWRCAKGRWASRCRAGTCRSSTRTSGRSPAGERGEICLRARSNPHYPLGYWRNDEAGEETFGGEWFHTKDAAVEDEDGYYWYVGRADDVIIAAGYRIGPFEVESACLEHPAVREAAVVASPDELRGNVVKAFIVLADGYAASDELATEIKQFVRERLSAYAYPRLDRVRARPAEDADGQDPADRAPPARARPCRQRRRAAPARQPHTSSG